jgi:polyvinyl alcohol dehydrogenase (cytochrome)
VLGSFCKFGFAAALILAGCARSQAHPGANGTPVVDVTQLVGAPQTGTLYQSAAPAAPTSPAHPGKAVYDKTCAACHDHPGSSRAPALEALKGMRYGSIHFALTEGKMQAQAVSLTTAERASLIDYLVGRSVSDDGWVAKMMCPAGRRESSLDGSPTVTSFGFDEHNQRHLTRQQAGLATADFRNLELAWVLGFPQATTMRAQAAVVGSTVFLPVSDSGQLYAIDVSSAKPCFRWVYTNDIPLRTGAAYGVLPGSGRKVLIFGDIAPLVHMIDASTGEEIWHQSVRLTSLSNGTGTPVLHGSRVYVPLSASEINFGADEKHECCTTHGAVFALDALTGHVVWAAHTMKDARPIRDRGDGKMIWGPSGAPIWNSPSIDEKRGLLYVGTGEATSEPAEPTTDAILALDLTTGAVRWRFQATANDIFLTGCMNKRDGLNCPKDSVFLDADFGASTILVNRPNGRDIILAGQKSSTLWALDPDKGTVLWSRNFGPGSITGGIHWGIAFDGRRVFAPISVLPGPDGKPGPGQIAGLHAINVDTGKVEWSFEAKPDCTGDRPKRVKNCAGGIGLSGAPTVVDGAVLAGSLDGFLRAFDASSGELLFQYDTARDFATTNGVPGKGGAIDNASIVAANGYVFVNSGYGLFATQTPGNILLAFRPKRPITSPNRVRRAGSAGSSQPHLHPSRTVVRSPPS